MAIYVHIFWIILALYRVLPLLEVDAIESCLRCQLPDEYCHSCTSRYGNLALKETPQFITFTYTGGLSHDDWETLIDIFDDDFVNVNDCPITISLFIISDRSDNCSVHRVHYRGHEVGLAGLNTTDYEESHWNLTQWEASMIEQRTRLHEWSHIPYQDMLGMRAQNLIPGSDIQFDMLERLGMVYDSSLMSPPVRLSDLPWPYRLEAGYVDDPNCTSRTCPQHPHPLIWEMPFIQLKSPAGDVCDYIETCFSGEHKPAYIQEVLRNYFNSVYFETNRAPVQINIRHNTLMMKNVAKGLKNFIKEDLLSYDDTWIVTMSDVIKWMRNPKSSAVMSIEADRWGCSDHREYKKCTPSGEGTNTTYVRISLSSVFDTATLWIYQTVVLIVLYIIIIRYDRKVNKYRHKDVQVLHRNKDE